MKPPLRRVLDSKAPAATLLIRLMVGSVFLVVGAGPFAVDAALARPR